MVQGLQSVTRRILVVDDEPSLQKMLAHALEREGFQVQTVGDGEEALEAFKSYEPHLIILDIMLPKLDGTEVCSASGRRATCPSSCSRPRTTRSTGSWGWSSGPTTTSPSRSPCGSWWRGCGRSCAGPRYRRASARTSSTTTGCASTSPAAGCQWANEEVDLTYTEFELLVTLASSPGRVFSRSSLLRRVWGDEFRDERTVDVHIRHLREKIERDPRNPEFIHTARGVGYVFR